MTWLLSLEFLVNGTKEGKKQVLSFFPNETQYIMHLPDRFTRYKFYLSARTQVGSGEVYAEESPHFSNEGELTHIQHILLTMCCDCGMTNPCY